MAKVIFHIDLNAFFANAEILLNPSLKGKPIAVSGNTRRSVISTCSYEARKYGVKSAMSVQEAQKICKDLIIVNANYNFYKELSNKFINIIKKYSMKLEQASIDECYVDVTEKIMTYNKPLDMAIELQKEILNEVKVPCSIGIAPNKFLAKMASDLKKPMGITVIRLKEIQTKLWPLDIKEMRGVGSKTVLLLRKLNINTIGDLANYKNKEELKNIFGKYFETIIDKANGKDDSEIVLEYDTKSISNSTTFLEDIVDYTEIKGILLSLSRTVSRRLKKENKIGYIVNLVIKYFDFNQVVRSRKLEIPIYSENDIMEHVMELFDENWDEIPIRLLGVGISKLIDSDLYYPQLNLFDEIDNKTDDLINSLNKNYNLNLKRASNLLKKR
ncbi:MAG: DNA polymerase IV [Erysipelotrichaceae bacterium]|nr:DNA polymerase IV [Erysipelotrichaceae bacterium]